MEERLDLPEADRMVDILRDHSVLKGLSQWGALREKDGEFGSLRRKEVPTTSDLSARILCPFGVLVVDISDKDASLQLPGDDTEFLRRISHNTWEITDSEGKPITNVDVAEIKRAVACYTRTLLSTAAGNNGELDDAPLFSKSDACTKRGEQIFGKGEK